MKLIKCQEKKCRDIKRYNMFLCKIYDITKSMYLVKFIIYYFIIQSNSSVAQSCPTLCNHMDCSTPGFAVHYQLPELAQSHVRLVRDAIQPSHPLSFTFSSTLQSFPASGSLLMSQPFISSGQSIGVSASSSVLPMNAQD